ncbi:hypothetical protein ANN_22222 [Periplaneta americana]|uniref:Mos1 transposase HTH domain-containing protein n=1 Tax=Periplaneta americana TaxID=6978 RepID=A0ABQ8S7J1_PERAM|nr:hypothetical protein ANN_22222 [Periplaneta americana]
MVVGKLSPDGPSIPHLVCVKELSKVNSQAIAYFVNKGLQSLYSSNIDDSKVLLFSTDAASYMVAAAPLLKTFYPNLTHVTCLAHGLHRVSETIRNEFPLVNSFISNTKKCFCKAPSRISIFRENFPDIPLPPQPVVTRWGTWIQSVVYYSKYFKEVVTVIDKLPETDSAACVKAVKDCLNDSRVKNDIAYITSNFSFIPASIEQLEREKQSLCSQIAIVKEAQVNIHSALGETGKKFEYDLALAENWCEIRVEENIRGELGSIGHQEHVPVPLLTLPSGGKRVRKLQESVVITSENYREQLKETKQQKEVMRTRTSVHSVLLVEDSGEFSQPRRSQNGNAMFTSVVTYFVTYVHVRKTLEIIVKDRYIVDPAISESLAQKMCWTGTENPPTPAIYKSLDKLFETPATLYGRYDEDKQSRQGLQNGRQRWFVSTRAVIKQLVKEEKSASEIHLRLQRAYGDVCIGASSVRRWVKHFEDGNTSKMSLVAVALELPLRNATKKELMVKEIRIFGWETLPQSPYNPELAPIDAIDKLNEDIDSIVTWTKKFHLNINPGKTQAIILGHKRQTDAVKHLDISPAKEQLRGQRYEMLEDIRKAVRQCLWEDETDFYSKGIFKFTERRVKCVQRMETMLKNTCATRFWTSRIVEYLLIPEDFITYLLRVVRLEISRVCEISASTQEDNRGQSEPVPLNHDSSSYTVLVVLYVVLGTS